MVTFATLWANHVGREFVCDERTFGNQCAMRMGKALEDSGINLSGYNLKRCTSYSKDFHGHNPGHIRSAQDLANVLYKNPHLLGAHVKRHILNGSIDKNISSFKKKNGMVFIMNGWGNTDHIDLWNGATELLRGSSNTPIYRTVGQQVWFWEI